MREGWGGEFKPTGDPIRPRKWPSVVARWANRFLWKYTDIDGYRRSIKTPNAIDVHGQPELAL